MVYKKSTGLNEIELERNIEYRFAQKFKKIIRRLRFMNQVKLRISIIIAFCILCLCKKTIGQECQVLLDSGNVEKFGCMGNLVDSNILNLYSNNRICVIYYSIIYTNTIIFILYDNEERLCVDYRFNSKLYHLNIKTTPAIFKTDTLPENGSFHLYSNNLSRDWYDYLYVKYYSKAFEVVPIGCLIEKNNSCIELQNKALSSFIKNFFILYRKVLSSKKIKNKHKIG